MVKLAFGNSGPTPAGVELRRMAISNSVPLTVGATTSPISACPIGNAPPA
jgi:hypothetical protein